LLLHDERSKLLIATKGKSNGINTSDWEAHRDSSVWSVLLSSGCHYEQWGELGKLGILDRHRSSDSGGLNR
jgi:hypothetical protein